MEAVRRRQLRQRRIIYWSTSAAAVVALLLAAGWWLPNNFLSGNADADWLEQYAMSADTVVRHGEMNEVKLVLANGKNIRVGQDKTVAYTTDSRVLVGADAVAYRYELLVNQQGAVDEIITPAGKQAQVLLADGTKLRVNAGTRVFYPHRFEKSRREIFVDGEVYLEVARNEQAPFYVRTRNFSVQVLGTKFNVASYQSEPYSSVVLVEGSVKVENKSQDNAVLAPNQLIRIQDGHLDAPVKVDVEQYISWTDNLLVYEEESLSNVLKKLELYYGKKFIVEEQAKGILISGKLELKDDLGKVLHTLAYAFPIAFDEQADTVLVSVRGNN